MMPPRRLLLFLRTVSVISGTGLLASVVVLVHHHRWNSGSSPPQSRDDDFNMEESSPASFSRVLNVSATFKYLPRRFQVIPVTQGRLIDLDEATSYGQHPFNCMTSKTVPSFNLCIYDQKQDRYISASLLRDGIWEPYITKAFERALNLFPRATVIDVGANIGYYSFLSASRGHSVIALEPQREHQRRFVAGAKLNGEMSGRILLLGNALSDGHYNVSLSSSADNQGGIRVLEDCGRRGFLDFAKVTDGGKKKQGSDNKCNVLTIALDDLLHVMSTSTAIMKLDIEGHECRAMRVSKQFFTYVNVPYILMEWRQMTERQFLPDSSCSSLQIKRLSNTLSDLGYVPHEIRSGIKLNPYSASEWHVHDVYWRKRDQNLLFPSM